MSADQTMPTVAASAITAGQLVVCLGKGITASPFGYTPPLSVLPTAYVASGGSEPSGVATQDAAAGQALIVGLGGTQQLTASGAIAQNDAVRSAAAGRVRSGGSVSATDHVGTATAAATDGQPVMVRFR